MSNHPGNTTTRLHPLVGVKYCGGCNPQFERKALVQRMLADYPGVVVEPVFENDTSRFDLVLIINGCHCECFDVAPYRGSGGQVIVSSPAHYQRIDAFLQRWYAAHT